MPYMNLFTSSHPTENDMCFLTIIHQIVQVSRNILKSEWSIFYRMKLKELYSGIFGDRFMTNQYMRGLKTATRSQLFFID